MGGGVPTTDIRIDCLKPAVGNHLIAAARVRRAGRTATIDDIVASNEHNALVAIDRGTYASVVG